MDTKICEALIFFTDLHDIREIKSAVHTVSHHIVCKSDDIYVSGSLTVTEESSFHSVRSRQYSQLGISHSGSAVVVRMNTEYNIIPVLQIFAHILDLASENMGHGNLYGGRKIDDHLLVLGGLPYIQHCVADLKSVLGLGL